MQMRNKRLISYSRTQAGLTAIFSLFIAISFSAAGMEETEKKINFVSSEGEKIAVPISIAKMSKTIEAMIDDLGWQKSLDAQLPEQDIPLNTDTRTLKAILASLAGLKELKEKKPNFETLNEFVRNSFVTTGAMNFSSDDIIKYILAANFLDIGNDLFAPAALLSVNTLIGAPKTYEEWAIAAKKLEQKLQEYTMPREIFDYYSDYLNWFKEPWTRSIALNNEPIDLFLSGTKLYVADYRKISVIDTITHMETGSIDVKGANNFSLSGTKLYVTKYDDKCISVIDTETDKVIEPCIRMDGHPEALFILGTKLYVANRRYDNISVIDTKTDRLIGKPIILSESPKALMVSGTKLYVAGYNFISVIDTETDTVLGQPIWEGEMLSAFALFGTKLYVAGYNFISVIDTKTDTVVGQRIKVCRFSWTLAQFGTKLYVGNPDSNSISVIDTETDKVIEASIKGHPQGPFALMVSGTKLYVANSYNRKISIINIAPHLLAKDAYAIVNEHINDVGDTLLIKAVFEQNVDEVRKLLAAGANPLVPKYDGASAVNFAEWGKNTEIRDLICEHFWVK